MVIQYYRIAGRTVIVIVIVVTTVIVIITGNVNSLACAEPPAWVRLCSLHLGNNNLSALPSPLSKLIPSFSSLQSLSLERCCIGDDGIAALAPTILQSKISHLDLAHCGISAIGACALAEGLSQSSSSAVDSGNLSSLVLSGNTLSDDSVAALAAALVGRPSLRALELGECGVTARVFGSLAKLTQLTSLSMFGNRMGDDALDAVMQYTPHSVADGPGGGCGLGGLHLLGLSGNELGCAALTKFLQWLQALPAVVRCDACPCVYNFKIKSNIYWIL